MASHVLLTGGTGLIGRNWLPLLLAANPQREVTVVSRGNVDAGHPRTRSVRADISLPRLGLGPCGYGALRSSVTEIIHCAANIRFDLPLEESRNANLRGTEHLLQFAESCPRLTRFAHISTVYIIGCDNGTLPEGPYTNRSGFFNTYQQSKYEAEQCVADAIDRMPVAVLRLSTVIGDSKTGRVEQFNYFHQLLKLVPLNPVPLMPGIPDARVDLIACDWATQALALLYDRHFEPNRFFHVCSGAGHSMTVEEIVRTTFQQVASHSAYASRPLIPPRIVTPQAFQDFINGRVNGGDIRLRELTKLLDYFLPHLGIRQQFANRETLSLLESDGLVMPPVRDYYPRILQYCLDSNWRRA